jgi:hypothetical protein
MIDETVHTRGALIELTSKSQIAGHWTKPLPDGSGDFLAMVYRDGPDAVWKALYRFRYFVDDKVWDSDDTKRAYAYTPKDNDAAKTDAVRDHLVEMMDMAFGLIPGTGSRTVPTTGHISMDELAKLPGMHSKMERRH